MSPPTNSAASTTDSSRPIILRFVVSVAGSTAFDLRLGVGEALVEVIDDGGLVGERPQLAGFFLRSEIGRLAAKRAGREASSPRTPAASALRTPTARLPSDATCTSLPETPGPGRRTCRAWSRGRQGTSPSPPRRFLSTWRPAPRRATGRASERHQHNGGEHGTAARRGKSVNRIMVGLLRVPVHCHPLAPLAPLSPLAPLLLYSVLLRPRSILEGSVMAKRFYSHRTFHPKPTATGSRQPERHAPGFC